MRLRAIRASTRSGPRARQNAPSSARGSPVSASTLAPTLKLSSPAVWSTSGCAASPALPPDSAASTGLAVFSRPVSPR